MGEATISRSVEIPEEDMIALRALAPSMWQDAAIRAGGRLSDARLIRIAIYAGLAVLERQYRIEEAA